MVTFSFVVGGKSVLGFGLTVENLRRLQDGDAIAVRLLPDGEEPPDDQAHVVVPEGPLGQVLIIFGHDEDDLRAQLAPYIGADTIDHDYRVKVGGSHD